MPTDGTLHLHELLTKTTALRGTVWSLEGSSDLNANLVRFPAGEGVGEHLNEEVDVLLLGVAGSGVVTIREREHALYAGDLLFVPKGAWRKVRSATDDFAYLSVHCRRGLLRIGKSADRTGGSGGI